MRSNTRVLKSFKYKCIQILLFILFKIIVLVRKIICERMNNHTRTQHIYVNNNTRALRLNTYVFEY